MPRKRVFGVPPGVPTCVPRELPVELHLDAMRTAVTENPANGSSASILAAVTGLILPPQHLALLTQKYWGQGGVRLTVGFLEPTPADLRARILSHMNAWGDYANVAFAWTQTSPEVRITRSGDGYWSYVGTDVRHIAPGQPTMCLQGFTMGTPEGEYRRVVRHETGHTLGFVHEQQLPEIVELLDVARTIAWGKSALGWDEATVRSQILTPIDPRTVTATTHADVRGVMCYMLPASITKNGVAVPGGTDIDSVDGAFAATLYPKAVVPPPPPVGKVKVTLSGDLKAGTYEVAA